MAGEDSQDRGREGLERAKQWLDLSTRVRHAWAYDDYPLAEMVHFEWPYATGRAKPFSFDLGGQFRGEPLDGQSFLAEVKNYRYESDLPEHFRDFWRNATSLSVASQPGVTISSGFPGRPSRRRVGISMRPPKVSGGPSSTIQIENARYE